MSKIILLLCIASIATCVVARCRDANQPCMVHSDCCPHLKCNGAKICANFYASEEPIGRSLRKCSDINQFCRTNFDCCRTLQCNALMQCKGV